MTIPVWFQDWYNNGSGGIAAAAQVYIDRVEADGGTVESIGCVPSAVWDWVAPSLLLDLFPNAAAAYSLRKLRAAYSGSAVRVRKEVSSVSSETDIGFAADGSLDTVSLLAFASDADNGDVFVVTWYDQSLNNDATQSVGAAQPKIVSGGSLVTENGKAAILPVDRSNCFVINPLTLTSNTWVFSTIKNPLGQTTAFVEGDNANEFILITSATSTSSLINSGYSSVSFYKDGAAFNPATRQDAYNALTGQSLLTASFDGSISTFINIGYPSSALIGMFQMQEFIIYSSDQSANRTAIEANINTFYSIYP